MKRGLNLIRASCIITFTFCGTSAGSPVTVIFRVYLGKPIFCNTLVPLVNQCAYNFRPLVIAQSSCYAAGLYRYSSNIDRKFSS